MHKNFYASGFLYHPPTEQILLQQLQTAKPSPLWSLLSGISLQAETPIETFKRIVKLTLHVALDLQAVFPIYTYFHDALKKDNWISYAEIEKLKEFPSTNGVKYSWFTRKQILKLPLDEQTRQDIIVGFRVIDARSRKNLGLHTLE